MSNSLIDDIEKRLREDLTAGNATIRKAIAQELDLAVLPAWAFPQTDFVMPDSTLVRVADSILELSGKCTLDSLGAVRLKLQITAEADRLRGKVLIDLENVLSLNDFLQKAGTGVVEALSKFLELASIKGFNSVPSDDETDLDLQLSWDRSYHIGPVEAAVTIAHAILQLTTPKLRSLSGSVRVKDLTLNLLLPADGDLQFNLDAHDLSLAKLIETFGITLPPLPPLPLLTQGLDGLSLQPLGDQFRIGGKISWPSLGSALVSLATIDGQIGIAVCVDATPGLKFSTLEPALAPLDVFLAIVAFDSPTVVLSSISSDSFPVPNGSGGFQEIAVEEGVSFRGQLTLSGYGLEIIRTLLGVEHLPFTVPVAPTLADIHLKVDLAKKVDLLEGALTIDHFSLSLSPEPLEANAKGLVKLVLGGQELPKFILGAGLSPDDVRVSFQTAEPWHHPIGLPIDIDEAGLQLSGPVAEYGFFGKIRLTGRILAVATKFVPPSVPTFLVGSVQGDLSLLSLVKDLVGIDLPLALEPMVKDPTVYIVLNPLGESIADRHYPPGVGLSGTLSFLGLSANLFLNSDSTHVVARAALIGPIIMDPVLRVTGSGGESVPSLAIDSQKNPVATLSGHVEMLGLAQDIHGIVDSDSISFDLNDQVGPVDAALSATLGKGKFHAEGSLSFGVKGSIGPVRLSDTGMSLGTIELDTGFSATTLMDVEGPTHRLVISGNFSVVGVMINVPSIELNVDSLDQIPTQIVSYLKDHAATLFTSVLTDADAWIRAIGAMVISGVENVAKVLVQEFQKDSEYSAKAIADTLNKGVDEAARQLHEAAETTNRIATSLANIKRAPVEIRSALEKLGIPSVDVTAAMGAAFPGIPHIDGFAVAPAHHNLVPHIDTPAGHTDVAGLHADFAINHVDTNPHLDIGHDPFHADGSTHVDTFGHTDETTQSHVDIPIAHLDTPEVAPFDIPGVGHIDTP